MLPNALLVSSIEVTYFLRTLLELSMGWLSDFRLTGEAHGHCATNVGWDRSQIK